MVYKIAQSFTLAEEISSADCVTLMAIANSVDEASIDCTVSSSTASSSTNSNTSARRLSEDFEAADFRRLAVTAEVVTTTADQDAAAAVQGRDTADAAAAVAAAAESASITVGTITAEEPTVTLEVETIVRKTDDSVVMPESISTNNIVKAMKKGGNKISASDIMVLTDAPTPLPPGMTFEPTILQASRPTAPATPAPPTAERNQTDEPVVGDEVGYARTSAALAASAFSAVALALVA